MGWATWTTLVTSFACARLLQTPKYCCSILKTSVSNEKPRNHHLWVGGLVPPLFLAPCVLGCCKLPFIVTRSQKYTFSIKNHEIITCTLMVPAT